MSRLTRGCCFLLEPKELAERFSGIAIAATLATKGDGAGAQAPLQHIRTVPFDMGRRDRNRQV
jgi:hypothetical protein